MMKPLQVTVHKWGNTLGIRIPKEVAKREGLEDGKSIDILFLKDNTNLRKSFGSCKGAFTRPTQDIKDELRKELYD
ncbi:MAG: AbrB/MazE/SpoVT family DNA-binding domain-containing protein [Candidatus Altiarchaeota archaeon]